MYSFLNQYSFVAAAAVLLPALFLAVRRRSRRVRWISFAAMLAAFALYAVALRTGPGDLSAAADLDRYVGHGQPVALELYSNY